MKFSIYAPTRECPICRLDENRHNWKRSASTARRPCMVCGKKDGKCLTPQCEQIALCHYQSSGTPARSGVTDRWLYVLDTRAQVAPRIPRAQTPSTTPLPAATVAAIYRDLLTAFPILPTHHAYLLQNGVDPAPCGSFLLARSASVAATLVKKYGVDVCRRHPALKEQRGRGGRVSWIVCGYADGILFPAGDGTHITGLHLRKNNPRNKNDRYVWLSHNGMGGTPLTIFRAGADAVFTAITEGFKKGATARIGFNCHVVSLAGVNAFNFDDLLAQLDALGQTRIVLMFDMDKLVKPAVLKAEQTLLQKLKDCRPQFTFEIATWDAAYKGIDDALNAGALIARTPATPVATGGLPVNRVINERYISDIELVRRVTLVQSPKNSAKTEWAVRLSRATIAAGKRVLVFGHRVTLLEAAAQRHGITSYRGYSNSKKDRLAMSAIDDMAICVDSLGKLDTEKLKNVALVLIDESEQVLQHLTGDTIRANRQTVVQILNYVLKQSARVVCLDADMGLITYNYLSALFGSENIDVVRNVYKAPARTMITYEKKSELLLAVRRQLASGKKLYISTNSCKQTRVIGRLLAKEFPALKGWVICSDTTDADTHARIAHINKTVVDYDYVVCSPTLGTGVSIDVLHFDSVFLIAETGITTHQDLHQQIARVRQPLDGTIHVWVSASIRTGPTDPATIRAWCIQNAAETGVAIQIDDETGERRVQPAEAAYLDLHADVAAARNLSWHDLRGAFLAQAAAEGHTVIASTATATPAEIKILKEESDVARAEVHEEDVTRIEQAADISEFEFQRLKRKEGKSNEERARVARYSLRHYYNLPVERSLIEADDEGRARGQVRNLIALSDPDYAAQLDRDERENPELMLPDLRNHSLKSALRRDILAGAGIDLATMGVAVAAYAAHKADCDQAAAEAVAAAAAATAAKAGITRRADVKTAVAGLTRAEARAFRAEAAAARRTAKAAAEAAAEAAKAAQEKKTAAFAQLDDVQVSADSLRAAGFVEKFTPRAAEIERVLGLTVREDFAQNPVELVSAVFGQMGLTLQSRQVRTGATRVRSYWLEPTTLQTMRWLADARRAILDGATWALSDTESPGAGRTETHAA